MDGASNFGTGNHLLQPGEGDRDVDAYNNIPNSSLSADNALTVLGVLNGVQVGVSYPKAESIPASPCCARSFRNRWLGSLGSSSRRRRRHRDRVVRSSLEVQVLRGAGAAKARRHSESSA